VVCISSKAAFYPLYEAGALGNRGPCWRTLDEYLASGYQDRIGIRTRKAGGRCDYYVPREEVPVRVESFLRDGYQLGDLSFQAMCPDQHLICQGEIVQGPWGTGLLYSTERVPMRVALPNARQVAGATANAVLRSVCDPDSYEWIIEYLLPTYPNHVIEFTSFSRFWGTIPRRNTVIWEVRLY
jgi:hypothetical protein